MAENTDVVIIGGGAAGCSVAYYLSLAGVKAMVIEREGIGTQASGFSAGGLNPLEGTNIPGPLGSMAIESFRMHRQLWSELQDSTGIDYEARVIDLVKVAFQDSDLPELEESLRLFNAAQDPAPASIFTSTRPGSPTTGSGSGHLVLRAGTHAINTSSGTIDGSRSPSCCRGRM